MRIYFRGTREQARDAIIGVVRSVTGNAQEHLQLARSVHTAMGLAALSDIKEDFVRKARGETGEDGVKWPPLSPKTLAYGRRFGSGEQANLKRAHGLGPGNRYAPGNNMGLLSASQLKTWKGIFSSRLRRLAASMPLPKAKAIAAAIAWTVLKRMGAKTKLEVYGNRQHEILRDTGVLLNSLSFGEVEPIGGEYTPPADQIFKLTGSGVIVGTNVPYAAVHQNGSKKKGIPARPFLPVGRVPAVWVQRWVYAGRDATAAAIRMRLGGLA